MRASGSGRLGGCAILGWIGGKKHDVADRVTRWDGRLAGVGATGQGW
jgi:hypothetical protein